MSGVKPFVLLWLVAVLVTTAVVAACNVSSGSSAGDDSADDNDDDGGDDAGADDDSFSGPTYRGEVAPILTKNCLSCHVAGGIAPFPLDTYQDAFAHADEMQDAVLDRAMPPWNIDNSGECQTFSNARWLSDEDIATISDWVDAGAPEGDSGPDPGEPPSPPTLDRVDLSLDIGTDFTPTGGDESGQANDEYRCFVLRPESAVDQFITAYEVVPGDAREVHHVALYGIFTSDELDVALQNDADDPGPGYQCFGGSKVGESHFMGLWFPGMGALHYPDGSGLRLRSGLGVILQVHYNIENGAYPDRTRIDMTLEDSVANEGMIYTFTNYDLNLTPGQALVEETSEMTVPAELDYARLWGIVPHMHLLGKTHHLEFDRGGETTCLDNVEHWDFHWHAFAMYTQPITLYGGDVIRMTCGYDTRGQEETVTYGEGTHDEMCVTWMYLTK